MIEVNNLTTIRVDERFLKKVAEKVLKGEKAKKDIELSIALVKPERMREINKNYRKRNKATDVLAFPELKKIKISPKRKAQNLGEIIICPSQVKKNIKRFNSTFKKEIARVLIHGILHLLGYDHEKPKRKAKKMEEKQQYYFKQLAILLCLEEISLLGLILARAA